MSTAPSGSVAHDPVADVTPVRLDASSLESTAPEYLQDLRGDLAAADLAPVELRVRGQFDADCSLATQEEADRIRGLVRAAGLLGVNRVTVTVEDAAAPEAVRSALSACAERAEREGIRFRVDGPAEIEG